MAHWPGRAVQAAGYCALVLEMATSAHAIPPASIRHRLPPDVAAAIEPAVIAATRRLSEPECGRLLSDFVDGQGRPLEERLGELGLERDVYFGLVVFVDGRNTRACQRRNVAAVTTPGGRVVALCPVFLRLVHEERRLAEGIVIHEALHTLGLQENPPSSLEINQRIFERCGR